MLETNITTWDELQRKHPDINVNSVNEAIRQSPHPINKRALKSLFNAASEAQPKTTRFIPQIFHAFLPSTKRRESAEERNRLLTHCLDKLANDNSNIAISKNRGYRSKEPYADIAVATITELLKDGSAQGKVDGLPAHITKFSISQTRRHRLQEGERYLVKIDRNKENGALNLFPIEHLTPDEQKIYIAGTHSGALDTVTAADPTLKTIFKLSHAVPPNHPPHPVLEIDLKSFDIKNPVISYAQDQGTDISSGRRISQILGQRYGLDRAHPFRAKEEAEYIAHKSIPPHKRKDYRDKFFFTVDPENPNIKPKKGEIVYGDFDDAICIERAPSGQGYRAYVAIADVPAFIRPESHLDKSAFQRATSFYFDDNTTYHMLPEDIATNHLSLLGHHDRAAVILEMDFDETGEMTSHNYNLATINSKKQMTYPSFGRALKKKAGFLTPSIELFTLLSQRSNEERKKHISSMLLLDDPTKLSAKKFVPTFMSLANKLIHETIHEHYGYGCFRNCGPLGEQSNYNKIRKVLTGLGHQLPEKAADCGWDTLDNVIKEANRQEGGEYDNVLTLLKTYLIERAYYSPDPLGHFPLGYETYGHATSPIRRYADIITLRMLHHIIDPQSPAGKAYSREELEDMTKHLNKVSLKEKRIKAFENKYHIINNVKLHAKSGAKAIITDMDHNHIEVMHTASGLTTDIIIDCSHVDDIYELNHDNLELIATDPTDGEQKIYRPGDSVPIKITEVDPTQAIWNCELAEPSQFISKRSKKDNDTQPPPQKPNSALKWLTKTLSPR